MARVLQRLEGCVVLLMAFMAAAPTMAGSLTYQPQNPSFGGSPLNGNVLFNQAQAQNEHERRQQRLQQLESATKQSPGGVGGSQGLTQGQLFARQLQSQLYSSLANKITAAIFGENAQQSGSFEFDGTKIDFRRVGANIELTINDGQSTTTVVVPSGI